MATRTQSPSPVAGSNLVARFYSRDGDQIVPAGSVALDHAGRAIFDRQAADFLRDATIIDVLGGKFQTVGPDQGAKYIANLPLVYDGTYFWARLEEDYYTPQKGWASGCESKYSAAQPRHPQGSSQGGQFARAGGVSPGVLPSDAFVAGGTIGRNLPAGARAGIGYDRQGFNSAGLDRDGYDREGYDEDGYDRQGFNRDGYDGSGYNQSGYNEDGYDESGFDRSGYDESGFDRSGYDRDGYNRDGSNRWGDDDDYYDPVDSIDIVGDGAVSDGQGAILNESVKNGVLDSEEFDDALANGQIVDGSVEYLDGTSSKVYRASMVIDGEEHDVYIKPLDGLYSDEIHANVPVGRDIYHERAAVLLNREMGNLVNLPTQVIVDTSIGEAGVQLGAPGTDFKNVYGMDFRQSTTGGHGASLPRNVKPEQMADMALFDTIIGNHDRHGGNAKWDDARGNVVAIDHGLAFPVRNSGGYVFNSNSIDAAHAVRMATLTPRHLSILARLKDNQAKISSNLANLGLGSDQISAMFERIDALQQAGRLPTRGEFSNAMMPSI